MRLAFVCPADPGGVLAEFGYCSALADALRRSGHDASLVDVEAWRALDPATRIIVDEAAEIGADIDDLVARRAVGLVRHVGLADGAADPGGAGPPEAVEMPLGRLARVIATSEAAAVRLRVRPGVPAEAIAVVPPGVAERPRSPGSGGPGCAILSMAAAPGCAGDDVLLRALARLFDLDWRMTIVSAAAPEALPVQTLMALADDLGVARRIDLVGVQPPDEREVLWARADVVAVGAPQDGYGACVAEALRRGIPVAMVGGDDTAALVAPDAGAVCAPGDLDTLSKSLRRMIFDTALRRAMADAAWRIGCGLPDWPTQAAAFVAAIGG